MPTMPVNYQRYQPLSEAEKITHQLPTHRSAWRVVFCKYIPFAVHFALTALVPTICLLVLDGRSFNVNSRRPEYRESDGSVSRLTSYAPRQSDITTAVSLAATATRVAAGWWGAGYIWRCIFLSMERGGVSLEGLSRVVSNMPPMPHNFKKKSNLVIISIVLFASFAIDYFSAALTGSITWEATNRLIPGSIPVTGIPLGTSGASFGDYFTQNFSRLAIVELGAASANLAWTPFFSNSANSSEPSTDFRRVLNVTQYLPVNSTLHNVTVPYFVVDAFEWIQDPNSILTPKQIPLFYHYYEFSPYFSDKGILGLLPDAQWGPPDANKLGDPQFVSETRLLSYRISRTYAPAGSCPQNYSVGSGFQINLHQFVDPGVYYDCFALANVTYRAGAAICQDCKIISPTIVQAQGTMQPVPDSFTSMALALAPSLGTYLLFSGYAVPKDRGISEKFAIELTSRAYQAAWGAYSAGYGNRLDSTIVQIAVPTLRAKVNPWRVYLWMGLHLWVLVLGLVFVYVQSHCDHPWVENPTMAVFWLNTTGVSFLRSDGLGLDPWQAGTKIPSEGYLILDRAGQPSRSVRKVD